MLPTLTHVAIASMQGTAPTPAATATVIAAGERPPRDRRTHALLIIGLQLLPRRLVAPPLPDGGHASRPRPRGSRTTTMATTTWQKR